MSDDDEAAFLNAIEANPDDADARAVYADWLDDRGDPRGEYLRLEAQLHSIPIRLANLRVGIDGAWLHRVERTFDLLLVKTGPNKISVIKSVREVTGIGLREAKDLVEATLPQVVKGELSFDRANELATAFAGTGAAVQVVAHGGRPIATTPVGITVTLVEVTGDRLRTIKAVREVTGLGLKESVELVARVTGGTPTQLGEGLSARDAANVMKKFEGLARVTS